jgi:hypothetical protein
MIIKFRSDNTVNAFRKISDYVKGTEDFYTIEIVRSKRKRSLKQNAYYHGVVVKIISMHTGYTGDEAHQELAKMFLSYDNAGKKFVRSTTKLTTWEFEQYLDKVRAWAKSEMDCHIPMPNEITEDIYIELNNMHERHESDLT